MIFEEGHKKDNIKDIEKISKKDIASIGINDMEERIIFIIQKAEKLTTAIYLITDFLDQKEPFIWNIRDKSLSLMSFISSISQVIPISKKEGIIRDVLSGVSQIISLLDLGVSVRLISQMNYSILKDEYRDLYNLINSELRIIINCLANSLKMKSVYRFIKSKA